MRIKCPHCEGKGFKELNSAMNMTCGWCMGQGELDIEVIPAKEDMTNEEWFCGLSTEEKADLLFGTFYLAGRNDEKIGDWKGVDTIMEWLKQPHQ